jgi:hypothetical protein
VQPVWVLSVDLQTKTATFQSGLSDAAKSARGAFTQIKEGSGEMGREVSGNMMEARHGVILLGEEFGIHLPRGVTTFLASIGPIGAAKRLARIRRTQRSGCTSGGSLSISHQCRPA